MAKLKRIIRKTSPSGSPAFDERLWPIHVALLVLGSFQVGMILANLRFDDHRWYANAWLALLAVPAVIGGVMYAISHIDSRVLRRAVMFSLVLSLLSHQVLMLMLLKTKIFSKMFSDQVAARDLATPRKQVTIPEYHQHHFTDTEERPKQEYEKPVETETPEPQPDQVTKDEPVPDPTPPKPQPTPVQEPERTVQPSPLKKQTTDETSPRYSLEQSKLSRQTAKAEAKSGEAVATPQATKSTPAAGAQSEPQAASVARQSTETPLKSKPNLQEPTTVTEKSAQNIAKREVERSTQPETAARPTLERQVAQPTVTPRTQVTAADTPTVTKQTTPDAIAPATIAAKKQESSNPQPERKPVEPTPDVSATATAQPQRREQPGEKQPTVAATPVPVENQRTRVTNRPETATVANSVSPKPSVAADSATPLVASATAVNRATGSPTTDRRPTTSEPETSASPSATAATVSKKSATSSPAAQPDSVAAPSLAKQTANPNLAPSTAADAAQVAAARQTQAADVSPASTATNKQATASPQVAASFGAPDPAKSSQAATAATATPSANRQPSRDTGPQADQGATSPTSRKTAAVTANVVTKAANVTSNSAPTQSQELQPHGTAGQVARQATSSSASSRSPTPLESAAASPSTQLAAGSVKRAPGTATASLDVPTGSNNSPARATRTAAAAASPTSVESPATAVAAQGAGEPQAQPARLALAKGYAGTSGAGQSPNLDRTSPADNSPALNASGSALRAKATQTTPDGPALAPSAPAAISRSVAGADRPSSTLKAEPVEVATTGGVAQPGELTSSASAALTQQSSNAAPGLVTASKGTLDVDLGPTQIVSDSGGGRAAGGGQPELNSETQSRQIARSAAGGAPQMSVAATEVAAAPAAPAGGKTGSASIDVNPNATTTVRTQAGGQEPVSGGPSLAAEKGPTGEPNAAPLLADAVVSRADNADSASGGGANSVPNTTEDEEEKARRLARASGGGAPQLALAGPARIDAPAGAAPPAGSPAAELQASNLAAASLRGTPGAGMAGGAPAAAAVGGAASGGAELAGAVRVTRAEAVEASVGVPATGGGTGAPARTATGSSFAANTQAATIAISGAPQSGGKPQGAPLEAQGVEATRVAGGVRGAPASGPVGAFGGQVAADAPLSSAPGMLAGQRQASPSSEDGPAVGTLTNAGADLKRASQANLAGGAGAGKIDVPTMSAEVAQATAEHLGGGKVDMGPMSRPAGGSLVVDIAAVDGPGGIGAQFTSDVGITNRRAQTDSVQVSLHAARFVRQNVGGVPGVNTAAVVATDPFRRRGDRGAGGGKGSPPPQTEESIELGLVFLARHQSPDGSWTLKGFGEKVTLTSDTAATGLALLAFQGAGYNHREHKYKDAVHAAVDFLVKNQKADGDLFLPMDDESNRSVWLYSHSIAALALCEAYGMTQDPALKEPAQKAIDFIVAGQNKERGGWRYAPGVGADTSVTGWMMMALKSGELSGLKVPAETYGNIRRWLDASQASVTEKHLYRYNPWAPDKLKREDGTEVVQIQGRYASPTMTSVGLLMRLYTGWRRDNVDMIKGAEYLQQYPPALGTTNEPQRDTYYWYYATQVMFHMGGQHWQDWNARLHPLLVQTQTKQGPLAGSWDPSNPVKDKWAIHAGRLYVTTMNLLSLEVYYRHLPLYEDTAK